MQLLLRALVLAASLAQTATTPAQQGVESSVALFDGRSLQGWTAKNTTPTTFSVKDGFIHVEGNSGWLQSEREYSNFRLRAEVRFLTDNADSGVFVRAVGDSIFLRGWPGNSYQVQARDVTRNQSANPILIGNIYRHGNPGGMTNFDSGRSASSGKTNRGVADPGNRSSRGFPHRHAQWDSDYSRFRPGKPARIRWAAGRSRHCSV